jgi:hypothetical protein
MNMSAAAFNTQADARAAAAPRHHHRCRFSYLQAFQFGLLPRYKRFKRERCAAFGQSKTLRQRIKT